MRLITDLTKQQNFISKKNIFSVATLYSLLVCKAEPKYNSGFFKLLTLVLKTSGCTKDVIDCFNLLGFCEGYRQIGFMREWFVDIDEEAVKKQASYGVCQIIFDNMDLYVKTLNQLTLPLLMFEVTPTSHLNKTDEMSLEMTLELFNGELLDFESERNRDEN